MKKLINATSLSNHLILLLIWSFIISNIAQLNWLIGLNLCLLCLFTVQLTVYQGNYRYYIKKWLKLHMLSLCILATLSWQITALGIAFSPQGLQLACLLILRFNLFILSLWSILINTSQQQLQYAISTLPLPKKLNYLIILTLRYIFLLAEINQQINLAMKARGFRAKCNQRSFLVFAQRVALLIIISLDRVEKVNLALKARGFYATDNKQEK